MHGRHRESGGNLKLLLLALFALSACTKTPSIIKHEDPANESRPLPAPSPSASPVPTEGPVILTVPTPTPDPTPSMSPLVKTLDPLLKPVIPFELVSQPVYLSFRASAPVTPNVGGTGGAALMDLMLANRFEEIQPELKSLGVKTIYTMGIYNHRTIAGTSRMSRHSYALAIDFSGFEFRDGKRAMVREVYDPGGNLELRKRLERIRMFLETKFDVVLGPGDRNHDDHFHVDLNPKKRPAEYPLSSGFVELVTKYGWVPVENFFYAGNPPWLEEPSANRERSPQIALVEDTLSNISNCED